jgi:type I restriction enzyme S subunit
LIDDLKRYPDYKNSGLLWLGEVPEHWSVVSLRRRWTVTDCKHLTVPFFERGIPLASVHEAQSFELKLDSCNHTTEEWYDHLIEGGRKPHVGDLIYCRNVSVGASAIVVQEYVFAMGQDVCLIRSLSENQRWFNYYLHSKAMAGQLALILVGSTFRRINVNDIKALLIPVPPRNEQDQISDYLDKELEQIEAAVAHCLQQQVILREYRTGLISDVVTGKLDVKGIDLPAEENAEVPAEDNYLFDQEAAPEDCKIPEDEIPVEAD